MASVNERLQDRAIERAVLIQQYGRGVADRIVRLLNSGDAEIVAKLGARLAAIEERGFDVGPATTARLNALLDEIRILNREIYRQMEAALTDELVEFSAVEGEQHRAALVASMGVDLDTKLPSANRLRAIVTEAPMEGRLLSSWFEGMEAGRIDRISQAVRLGMMQGEGTDAIVRRIRGTKAAQYSDGVLDISRRSAQAVVRTSVNHVNNVAAQATWSENQHIVKGWQYLATLDGRTTITCAGLSGQVFAIGKGPIPPRHVNCRSISVPVTKSFKELGIKADELPPGTRASMDGQVASDTTFAKWLHNKGPEMQDRILGPTRAKLFRDGKYDLKDFIKKDGTVVTLRQLRQS